MAIELDGFVFNGTEYEIKDTTARQQIAQQVASRTETNANYAAEVIDARVGDNGQTYPSLGEAIRQQINALQAALTEATRPAFYGKTFSIIGDGTTAFPGFLPQGCTSWYNSENSDIEFVDDMFWGKLISKNNMKLIINNSSNGTKMAYDGENRDSYMAGDLRISQLGETEPDYIFILGGMNDINSELPLGEFTPTLVDMNDLQEEHINNFASAYKVLIQKLMAKFKNSKIVVLWYHNMSTCPTENVDYTKQYEFAEVAEKVAKFYGCQWIDFRKSGITMANNSDLDTENYPTKDGHELYYNYLAQHLQ